MGQIKKNEATLSYQLGDISYKIKLSVMFSKILIKISLFRTTDYGHPSQRYLKNWTDVADKICVGRTYLGMGVNFWSNSEGYFLYGRLCYYRQSPNNTVSISMVFGFGLRFNTGFFYRK